RSVRPAGHTARPGLGRGGAGTGTPLISSLKAANTAGSYAYPASFAINESAWSFVTPSRRGPLCVSSSNASAAETSWAPRGTASPRRP
ncbi:MAG: hypothetical protein NTZ05_16905, partial [Chloroflexi bacterium]|nr:hypothetical protein [Chloroflexota bacterium]